MPAYLLIGTGSGSQAQQRLSTRNDGSRKLPSVPERRFDVTGFPAGWPRREVPFRATSGNRSTVVLARRSVRAFWLSTARRGPKPRSAAPSIGACQPRGSRCRRLTQKRSFCVRRHSWRPPIGQSGNRTNARTEHLAERVLSVEKPVDGVGGKSRPVFSSNPLAKVGSCGV